MQLSIALKPEIRSVLIEKFQELKNDFYAQEILDEEVRTEINHGQG